MKFYAVRHGRSPGIYTSWEECRNQVYRYPGAEYKAFSTREDAEAFLRSSQPESKTHPSSKPASTPIQIWVDGSCLTHSDGTLRLGWGLLVKKDGKEIHRAFGNEIPAEALEHRNVAGEIFAVRKALEWCRQEGISEVTLYYDYQGLEKWATGKWRTKLPFTQAYAQDIRQAGIKIHWVKVLAHSGDPENDLVDQLAKMGAQGEEEA